MMVPPLLVIAVGNESRGDDALGPLLLRRLQDWVNNNNLQDKIELLEDFQLQVEHAADLLERELVLFIDAGLNTPPPYTFYRIAPNDGPTVLSHALEPEDVLTTYVQVYQQPPPPCFVLCISGNEFELGEPLSGNAKAHLKQASGFTRSLLQNAKFGAWETQLTAP
jgi:hydrogenase maturation protease